MTKDEILDKYRESDPVYFTDLEDSLLLFSDQLEFETVVTRAEENNQRIRVVGQFRNALIIVDNETNE